MKYLIISLFCLTALLYADEDVIEFDNVQELLQWYSQKSTVENANQEENENDDMVIIKINKNQKIKNNVINNKQVNPIELLPDATILEETAEDKTITINEELIEITDENIDINSLPLATIVEENNSIVPINVQSSTTEIIKPSKTEVQSINATQVIIKDVQKIDQNKSKPITIVKYSENSLVNTCGSAVKEVIDFWQLLDMAMIKSTQLILKKHDIQISKKNMDIVKSEYYPNLTLGYSGEYYHGYSRDGSSIGGSYYPAISQYRDSLDLSVSHELYRFGATDLKMEMSKKDIEIVKSELALVEEDISKKLLEYFTIAVKSQINLNFKDNMRLIQDRILQKKWRLYEAGQVAKTVLLKDQLSLVSLEKDILKHKMNFIDAVKKIQILTNIELDPDSVKFAIPTPQNRDIKTFEESAVARNLKLKLEKKLQELELIKKDYKPTIYANSGFRLYGADDDSFTKTIENLRKNSWDAGVTLRWELFSGFKTNSTVEKIKIEIQKLTEQYRLAKIDFESQKAKRESLKLAIDKILRVESEILDQTCQQEDLYTRLESAGQISSLELDNIELKKLRSKLDFRLGVIDKVHESISSELIR